MFSYLLALNAGLKLQNLNLCTLSDSNVDAKSERAIKMAGLRGRAFQNKV